MVNNNGSTYRRTLFLSSVTGDIAVILHHSRFHTPSNIIRGMLTGSGVAIECRADVIRLSNRTVPAAVAFGSGTSNRARARSFRPNSFNVFIFAKARPRARLIRRLISLTPSNNVLASRSVTAHAPNLFTTNSVYSGHLHRIIATISSKTVTTADTCTFLHKWMQWCVLYGISVGLLGNKAVRRYAIPPFFLTTV